MLEYQKYLKKLSSEVLADKDYNNLPMSIRKKIDNLSKSISSFDFDKKSSIEQALQQSEEKFEGIFKHANIGIALGNANGITIDVNDEFAKMLEYEKEELLGKHFGEFSYPEDNEKEFALVQDLINNKSDSYRIEKRYITKNKNIIWVDISITARRNQDDSVEMYIGMIKDITEKKNALEKLKESETLHREILSNISDAVFLCDENNYFTFICPNVQYIFGYSREEVAKMQNIEVLIPNISDIVPTTTKQKELTNIEFEITDKNNQLHTILISAKEVNIRKPEILYTCRDITKRKSTNKKLRESEEKYRNLVEHSPDIIYQFSNIRGGLFWSPRVTEILGFKQEDLIENSFIWFNSIHPDDKNDVEEAINSYSKGADYNIEYRIKTIFGEYRWLSDKFMYKSVSDNEIIIEGHATDITEQKLAKQKLVESETKYRNLFDNSHDGLFILNEKGIFVDCNQTAEEITGYTRAEIIGRNPMLFSPEYQNENEKSIDKIQKHVKAANENKVVHFEWNAIKKNGVEFIVEITFFIYEKDDKRYTYASVKDITFKKQSEIALIDKQKELEQLIATKDKFFNIIAHDLRSPFNSILGLSKLVYDNYSKYDDKKRLDLIKTIKESSDNAFKLVDSLLIWARVQTGKIPFLPEEYPLFSIVNESITALSSIAAEKNIRILNTISNENVYIDIQMISTVLRNLMSNAIKFTQNNGTVVLSSKKYENFVEVSVIDTGVGIEKSRIDKLFEIEKSKSTLGTENEAGTGLGLILCKEFILKHGGKIWCQSEVNKGSKFSFTLPLSNQQ